MPTPKYLCFWNSAEPEIELEARVELLDGDHIWGSAVHGPDSAYPWDTSTALSLSGAKHAAFATMEKLPHGPTNEDQLDWRDFSYEPDYQWIDWRRRDLKPPVFTPFMGYHREEGSWHKHEQVADLNLSLGHPSFPKALCFRTGGSEVTVVYLGSSGDVLKREILPDGFHDGTLDPAEEFRIQNRIRSFVEGTRP